MTSARSNQLSDGLVWPFVFHDWESANGNVGRTQDPNIARAWRKLLASSLSTSKEDGHLIWMHAKDRLTRMGEITQTIKIKSEVHPDSE